MRPQQIRRKEYSNMTNFTWTDKQNNVDDVMAEDINSIAHAVQEINSKAGDLNYLNTTDKSNLVNAVNEINTRTTDIEAEIEEINDQNLHIVI